LTISVSPAQNDGQSLLPAQLIIEEGEQSLSTEPALVPINVICTDYRSHLPAILATELATD
jgi:hypothetical protein